MNAQNISINRLQSGGVITNYFCSSSCRHCLYRSSPRWPKDFIDADTARKNFQTIRRLGCRSVHLGGGEPMLRPRELEKTLKIAAQCDVDIDYVETNSSWYKDHHSACATLEKLLQSGLSTLLISISPFHNEYIPFSKTLGVVDACRQTGMRIFPWITDFVGDLQVFDEKTTHSLDEYLEHFGEDYLKSLPNRYWISPGGRALETFAGENVKAPAEEILNENRHGCTELLQTGHFHLDLYGNYIPGLCAGLSIQRDDLAAPLQSIDYPIITRLFEDGIAGFFSYAHEIYGYEADNATGYQNKCALCFEIRRFLVLEKEVTSRELQPVGHYAYG